MNKLTHSKQQRYGQNVYKRDDIKSESNSICLANQYLGESICAAGVQGIIVSIMLSM